MNKQREVNGRRRRRAFHVRNKIRGTADRPRLSIYRSLKHIYCQVIDDSAGRTLVAANSRDPQILASGGYGGNKDAAAAVGKALAERALAAGVTAVRFDRGSSKYHGRVAALADAARAAGLVF